MACHVIFEMTVKAGRFDDLRKWFLEKLPGTRDFEGNISVEVVRDQDDPTRIVFVEKWDARQDFERYLAWRTETGVVAELGELLEGGIDFRFHDGLGV
ncbi:MULTISPECIES: putative quinol monooxygenase [unclassified Streptomyces]|uniref:putative quinol monooxygenase n=1 Tax=unclassified Streptomyces TaxID=2593676 RepID=UPI0001D06D45|nr:MULTISPECIES: antibiotic biosynthesis monooxygenase family protein [unclassified Streptomyces]MYS42126.1 antibiotic biosynthesis monooxygenase [Streptomyces sp. SID5998]MYX41016.1 antibiotic biosynthesis monooxygenase [Streptomyces sp. SID89]NED70995.1 antibiotic biosynthesis monooxygenase [Streptomyces sp. SID9944]EFF89133.1 antibiotic biosynthesis monooxygenase subfamily [Streptomyces sp. e14]NED37135.1 antibiotic biosynthesis monooxygenase [Streptomyces sp. SID8499]